MLRLIYIFVWVSRFCLIYFIIWFVCSIDKISFNANLFKDVLSANKECSTATLEVSNDGLARINFKVDDYDSTYYIVATQGVD